MAVVKDRIDSLPRFRIGLRRSDTMFSRLHANTLLGGRFLVDAEGSVTQEVRRMTICRCRLERIGLKLCDRDEDVS